MDTFVAVWLILVEMLLAVARGAVTGFSIVWAFYAIGPLLSKRVRRPFCDIAPTRTDPWHMWTLARNGDRAMLSMLYRSARLAGIMLVSGAVIYSHWLMGLYETKPGFWANMWHYLALALSPVAMAGGIHEAWSTLKQVAGVAEQDLGDTRMAQLYAQEDAQTLDNATPEAAGRNTTRRL